MEKRSADVLAVGNETNDKHGGADDKHPDRHVGFLASDSPVCPGVVYNSPGTDCIRKIIGAVSER